jgi:hypothetical protein
MPRYTFHYAGPNVTLCEDHPSEITVRREARESAREVFREGLLSEWDMADWKLTVTDTSGKTICEVPIVQSAFAELRSEISN